MEETKKISVTFDANSIETLKQVPAIHRDSLINLGIALVKQTGYFKTLTGEDQPLEDVTSLATTEVTESQQTIQETSVPAATWDNF